MILKSIKSKSITPAMMYSLPNGQPSHSLSVMAHEK